MNKQKIRIGIPHGDINGISYEILIKTFMDTSIMDLMTPVIYGSARASAYHRKILGIQNFSFNQILSADKLNHKRPNLVNCFTEEISIELGIPTAQSGQAAVKALKMALDDIQQEKIDVLVTAPINKHAVHSEEFPFTGHTDFLQEHFKVDDVLMFMVGKDIRVGLVTEHIPISEVATTISEELILKKLNLMNESLKNDFSIRKPRIAVLGLNPHAGDHGVIGNEENSIIMPAIKEAYENGILAFGPYVADGFFGSGHYRKFDGILAMYHDQGLIPFKALTFGQGVNFTAGLPIVRTSPDHGTGYDIVGKNLASPESFHAALFLAIDIYRNRKMNEELKKNSLEKSTAQS